MASNFSRGEQSPPAPCRRWPLAPQTCLLAALLILLILQNAVATVSGESGNGVSGVRSRTVIAVIPPDSPPTYFRDPATGQPAGFAVEAMNAIGRSAGLDIRYEFAAGWSEIISRVEQGHGDLVPSMGISENRKEHLLFTEPIEIVPVVFHIRDSLDELGWQPEGRTVGVINHSIAHEILEKNGKIRLAVYSGFVEGMFDLLAGKVDAFACPAPTFRRLAQEAGVEDRIAAVGTPITETMRAVAVRKGDLALRDRLNAALRGFVGSPEYQRLYVKWYGKPKPFWTGRRIILTSALTGGFIVLAAGMAWWRYRTVVKLNRELQTALAEIKTLHGILPICSHCKKIRDDKGSWRQMEAYISEHTTAEFSHGICAECMEKFYPRYAKKKP